MKNEQCIYGLRALSEALETNQAIDKIFLQKGLRGELFSALEQQIRKKGLRASYVPIVKLNKLTSNNHQGAVAFISPVSFQDFDETVERILEEKELPFFLLLDGISDVRNFGAIIRSAECSGIDAIIIPKSGSAPINADTIKTSAGAVFNIPILKVDHLKDAIFYLQGSGIPVIAATEKAKGDLYSLQLNKKIAIVMGSEDRGVSPSVLKIVDDTAKLPLMGKIESLNVSVACGIFLYEVLRQRSN